MKYLKLLRVKHYLKNILIFVPLFFSGQIGYSNLFTSLVGFIAFSLISSCVYIINDIHDVENDRKHVIKSKRPIASGEISIKMALVIMGILFVVVTLLQLFTMKNIIATLLLATYLIINVLYTRYLKAVPIIDVAIIVLGFVIRVFFGASLVDVQVSNWLYLCIISLSFFLGYGKRRNEMNKTTTNETREVLKDYTKDFLDKNMYMCLGMGIVFYSLWCINISDTPYIATNNLIWSIPLVMVMLMKYSLNIERDSHGDPIEVILSDKTLIFLGLLYVIIMCSFLYII